MHIRSVIHSSCLFLAAFAFILSEPAVRAAESTFLYSRQRYVQGIDLSSPYAMGWFQGRDGMFYATYRNSANYSSAVYRMMPDGTAMTLIRRDGSNYMDGVMMGLDGRLYGTQAGSGAHSAPGVFRMNADGSGYVVIRSFIGEPAVAGVIQDAAGLLYGTTVSGGNFNQGGIFRMSTNGTQFERLHHFGSVPFDGQSPGRLIIGRDGWLYGGSMHGGQNGLGTIFKIARDGTGYSVLHHFSNSPPSGVQPRLFYPLLEGSDGLLYGVAGNGPNRAGTIFALGRDGSGYRTVHVFAGEDTLGDSPVGGLVEWCDGALYGTTYEGGIDGAGIVFRVNRDGSGFRALKVYIDGPNPGDEDGTSRVPLVLGTDGRIHGLTSGGSQAQGSKFLIDLIPALAIHGEPAAVTLSWPACAQGFALEFATTLMPSQEWRPVPVEPSEFGTLRSVRLSQTSHPFYFRLVRR